MFRPPRGISSRDRSARAHTRRPALRGKPADGAVAEGAPEGRRCTLRKRGRLMNHRFLLLAGALLCATGCLKEHNTARPQMEEENDRKLVRTIGDIADIPATSAIP